MKKIVLLSVLLGYFITLSGSLKAQKTLATTSDWVISYTCQYSHNSKYTESCTLSLYDVTFTLKRHPSNFTTSDMSFNRFYVYRKRQYCDKYASFLDEAAKNNFILKSGQSVSIKITTAVPSGNACPSDWGYKVN